MKHKVRANIYESSNVSFNCNTQEAYSYSWWCFFKDGIFNNCNYSPSTTKHQYKVKSLLRELNIDIKLELRLTTIGLHNGTNRGVEHGIVNALHDELHLINVEVKNLEKLIAKPRTTVKKNEERKEMIKELLEHHKNVSAKLSEVM